VAFECIAESAEEAAAAVAIIRAGRVLARRAWRDGGIVSSSSTSHMVDGTVGKALLAGRLALELIVEGENGSLGYRLNVAGSSTAAGETSGGLGERGAEERSWSASGGPRRGLWRLEGVSCSTASRVRVGGHVWVWLDDGVRHCERLELLVGGRVDVDVGVGVASCSGCKGKSESGVDDEKAKNKGTHDGGAVL